MCTRETNTERENACKRESSLAGISYSVAIRLCFAGKQSVRLTAL